MAEVSEFHTNKEYGDLIPPIATQDYSKLKDNIEKNGQHEEITVSNRTGRFVIIDGHNRYRIAQELGREPRYKVTHFASEAEEIQYICDCNIERRNLNLFQRAATILKIKGKLAEIAKKNSQANLKQNQPKDTDSQMFVNRLGRQGVNGELGKQAKTTHETIRLVERILKEAPQHIIDKAWRGSYTVNSAIKYIDKQKLRRELAEQAANSPSIKLTEKYELYHGNMLDVCAKRFPDSSIPLIFTDPRYALRYLDDYKQLADVASRVLQPGASLVFYPNYGLYETMTIMKEAGLTLWWQICVKLSGPHQPLYDKGVFVDWKPLLWFVKGEKRAEPKTTFSDYVKSEKPDKGLHSQAWEQSPVEAEYVISKLTVESQIVLDPFCGSGTTGIAALKLKRKFIGIEIDETDYKIAKANISKHLGGF